MLQHIRMPCFCFEISQTICHKTCERCVFKTARFVCKFPFFHQYSGEECINRWYSSDDGLDKNGPPLQRGVGTAKYCRYLILPPSKVTCSRFPQKFVQNRLHFLFLVKLLKGLCMFKRNAMHMYCSSIKILAWSSNRKEFTSDLVCFCILHAYAQKVSAAPRPLVFLWLCGFPQALQITNKHFWPFPCLACNVVSRLKQSRPTATWNSKMQTVS